MTRLADLSIEYAHLYLRHLDEERIDTALADAALVVAPLADQLRAAGRTVSTVIMIDDYFETDVDIVAEKRDLLLASCERAGLTPDWIASERRVADTATELTEALTVPPEHGDGSVKPPKRYQSTWLSNGQPPRTVNSQSDDRAGDPLLVGGAQTPQPVDRRTRSRVAPTNHSIHLDVELYRERKDGAFYSCPLLAAWWQLLRLGVLSKPAAFAEPTARDGPPLVAKRSLTVLSPAFLEVEHAVRLILDHVALKQDWRSNMRTGALDVGPKEHMERIGYAFVPEGFASALAV